MYQADLRIDHGNSGGPAFSSKDQAVIGIIDEIGGGQSAFAYILPAKYIIEFLDKTGVKYNKIK
ncbi:MAG: hypothetical protein ABI142_00520 [Bryocella sp.]